MPELAKTLKAWTDSGILSALEKHTLEARDDQLRIQNRCMLTFVNMRMDEGGSRTNACIDLWVLLFML